MLAGYAVGIALMVSRYARAERLYERLQVEVPPRTAAEYYGTPGVQQVRPLLNHRETYFADLWHSRYPDYVLTEPGPWIQIAMILLTAAAAGAFLGRLAPLRLAPGRLDRAPQPARGELRCFWRDALLTSAFPWLWAAAAGTMIGLSGAILGEAHAMVVIAVDSEAAWARGTPTQIEPIWGLLSAPDGAWLLFWAVLLPAVATIVMGRRRLRSDAGFADRWCSACGYPRSPSPGDIPGGESNPRALICPECGATQAPPRLRKTRPALIGVAVCLLALVLTTHVAAPSAISGIFGIRPGADEIVVPADTVICVRRPRERLWLRLEAGQGATEPAGRYVIKDERLWPDPEPEQRDSAARTRLRVMVQPDRQRARPANAALGFTVMPGGVLSATVEGGAGRDIEMWVYSAEDLDLVRVVLTPAGATSIRAVAPGDHPPFN